ncbi:DNA (cytosine-5-)-methyltransferase [Cellulomonas hominis]|uniref:DNA (cytosine-5-)-methyltransferase n=1 Tax=Cellulomonas hominis TaxID=156981 RepID=A0A511FI61_9CELL|nr:DNA cytosine methyltransferase [Cellulomonas hominis]MBB5472103.1 DNA (cytosine-5)-methyltransferase 1 [Cellulomonas hominis]GEL47508.1 DNA (cytosine-5-)-methyltransferase [Cellulomonas hominis]
MADRTEPELRVAEYFAGIGLAKMGLEAAGLRVTWSNDISPKKEAMFRAHFGDQGLAHQFHLGDLGTLTQSQMPERVDLAWASFPCTDLSLAGGRAGLHKGSSAAFWHFVKSLATMGGDRPAAVALENVTGFVSSRAGQDIRSAIRAMNGLGYSIDVVSIDARRFVPQSRPRLFLLGLRGEDVLDDPAQSELRPAWLDPIFADRSLRTHRNPLPSVPPILSSGLSDLAQRLGPDDARWWDDARTSAFLDSLSPMQSARLDSLRSTPKRIYRSAYRRMRAGVPRWEIRSDDIAGCLRTARGGSSRQAIVETGLGVLRLRWMTPLEYAKLMGAGDYSIAGVSDYDAFSGFGDAVCVPVVKWLAESLLRPALLARRTDSLPEQPLEIAS